MCAVLSLNFLFQFLLVVFVFILFVFGFDNKNKKTELWSDFVFYFDIWYYVSSVVMSPLVVFELLFFAIFGQTTYDELIIKDRGKYSRPAWTDNLFKIAFGIYMLVSVVVLINLLIAMMSDTYQRIQVISERAMCV